MTESNELRPADREEEIVVKGEVGDGPVSAGDDA